MFPCIDKIKIIGHSKVTEELLVNEINLDYAILDTSMLPTLIRNDPIANLNQPTRVSKYVYNPSSFANKAVVSSTSLATPLPFLSSLFSFILQAIHIPSNTACNDPVHTYVIQLDQFVPGLVASE